MGYYCNGGGDIVFAEAPPKKCVEEILQVWDGADWCDEKTVNVYHSSSVSCLEDSLEELVEKFDVESIWIEMHGEDDCHWRWLWRPNDDKLKEEYGRVEEEYGRVVYESDQNPAYERLRDILVAYVDNDYDEWAPGEGRQYVYKKLRNAVNCTDEEIEALGLGFLIPEKDETD